jgi:hypothetical protein
MKPENLTLVGREVAAEETGTELGRHPGMDNASSSPRVFVVYHRSGRVTVHIWARGRWRWATVAA